VPPFGSAMSASTVTGEAGTGGKIPRLTGRCLTFDFGGETRGKGASKVARIAVRGDGHVKFDFHTAPVGGGRIDKIEGLRGVPV